MQATAVTVSRVKRYALASLRSYAGLGTSSAVQCALKSAADASYHLKCLGRPLAVSLHLYYHSFYKQLYMILGILLMQDKDKF